MNTSTRTRGITAALIPDHALRATIGAHLGLDTDEIQPEQTWLIDRGKGDGPRYAITGTEGVGHAPTDGDPFEVCTLHLDGFYRIPIAALVTAADGGETWDLADVVRTFGARLEGNFRSLHRWALRQP